MKIGLTTVAVTRYLPSSEGFFKQKNSSAFGTVYYLNQDNPVPTCPSSYSLLTACLLTLDSLLTACKKTKHAASPWYRKVYMP